MPRALDIKDRIAKLRHFYWQEGRVPGYAEMLKLFGYQSKNAVFGLLKKLADYGYIRKSGGKIAFTSKLVGTVKLLGTSIATPGAWNPVLNRGGADIQAGKMVFDYASGSSPAATIRDLLAASCDGGLWDGGQFRKSFSPM